MFGAWREREARSHAWLLTYVVCDRKSYTSSMESCRAEKSGSFFDVPGMVDDGLWQRAARGEGYNVVIFSKKFIWQKIKCNIMPKMHFQELYSLHLTVMSL